ncbi:MAG: hypothetical protein HYS25_02205 [Ignavibacteriales bacterium]|nr:hypothetical protein [Ignavibacteriales bacterium]
MTVKLSIPSAIFAGITATVVMTAFTFMAPLMGFEMDIPKMLAGTMGAPIIIGWLAHFMVGIILAILYAFFFLPFSKREPNFKSGMMFSVIPWLMAQIMVMPMMSTMNGGTFAAGLFSGSLMMAMASLVGHLLYGVVLGFLCKPSAAVVSAGA